MQLFSGMRISHKISALMIGLILGFIVIGITYYVQINMDKGARQAEYDINRYQSGLTELALLRGEIAAEASDYFQSANPEALMQFQQTREQISGVISELADIDVSGVDSASVTNQLRGELNGYTGAVEQSFVIADELSESKKNLETTSNELQEVLQAQGFADLLTRFYVMKGLEAQLLTTTGSADIELLNQQVGNFVGLIGASDLTPASERRLVTMIEAYQQALSASYRKQTQLNQQRNAITATGNRLRTLFSEQIALAQAAATTIQKVGVERKQVSDAAVTAIIFMVAIGTAVGIYLIYKSIVFPMVHMQSVIRKINRGKTGARVKVLSNDELGDLGTAFNNLLDERIQQLEDQSKENESLNNSIIDLIRALGVIAQKDLTVKVPVSADITGTISDAVNLLTRETAKTLHQVKDISQEVDHVSNQLEEQSETVIKFAENERRQIIATSKALEVLANAMNDVARRSEAANKAAEEAIGSTQEARQTVLDTVSGIRTIRETISETEKRVKRLGDRSQEVSGIVNLINTIAERTHILALNASMHAASAGEAGKGFAVVADEVQRLAESARQSTSEIAAMVNSMRVDTSDTVTIMNTLISQVVDGTKLAEQAGQKMENTEQRTRELVSDVKVIAEHATQQAEIANRVKDRAAIIRNFTEKTGKQLEEQRKQTQGLKHHATTLVERVSVFVLPEDLASERKQDWSNVSQLPPAAEAS